MCGLLSYDIFKCYGYGVTGFPMPNTPCIKGIAFPQVVEDVEHILVAGAISRDRLGEWLRPENVLELTDRPLASGWYPIETYARINEVLRDVNGGGRNEFLRELRPRGRSWQPALRGSDVLSCGGDAFLNSSAGP